jgi:hypothetical protein
VAYQQSSGSTGYNYGGYRDQGGVGDGGNTIWLANSYWSDFNGEDERSWHRTDWTLADSATGPELDHRLRARR